MDSSRVRGDTLDTRGHLDPLVPVHPSIPQAENRLPPPMQLPLGWALAALQGKARAILFTRIG